jgi:hypothetical protein
MKAIVARPVGLSRRLACFSVVVVAPVATRLKLAAVTAD